ncbi:MAG: cation transporter [Micromonosporaceae bacterium]|nr:cation transporter [Micromonosporaceae bacterium]
MDHFSDAGRRRDRLAVAFALIAGFMVAEMVIGLAVGSLALLSDAAHLLTDAGAILLALATAWLATRERRGYTFGLKRAEIASAFINGVTLLVLAAWLGYEAVLRLIAPRDVSGIPVLLTALAGIVVNLLAMTVMRGASKASLNVRGAYLHILTDLFAFIATALAGLIMALTGLTRADGVATLVVVALMVRSGLHLVRESGRIFLEAAPAGIDPAAVGAQLTTIEGVVEVHDLHLWQITSHELALSAHVLVGAESDCHAVCSSIERRLREEYGLYHSTVQIDHAAAQADAASHAGSSCGVSSRKR